MGFVTGNPDFGITDFRIIPDGLGSKTEFFITPIRETGYIVEAE